MVRLPGGRFMLRRSCFAVFLGLCACGHFSAAGAQDSDRDAQFYEFARNKIGLLRYCRDQGLIGQITAERAIEQGQARIASIADPGASVRKRGDRAEKSGESGFWEANGQQDHASIAEDFRTTPAGLCKELAGLPREAKQAPVAKPRVQSPPAAQAPANTEPVAAVIGHTHNAAPRGNRAARPVAAAPRASAPDDKPLPFWKRSPFEVNKWRFNRREAPWNK